MKNGLAWAGLLAAGLWSVPAAAQTALDADWGCWYDGARAVQCVLVKAATLQDTAGAIPLPGQRPLPKSLADIHRGGSDLYGRVVEIPLLTEPDDDVLMQQLARYSVCGSAPACRMTFTRSQQEIVLMQELASSTR